MRDKYGIAGLPTVILAKPGGEEIDRTIGYVKTGNFISTVEGYQKGIGTLAAMKLEEKTKGKDPAFLFLLGEKFFAHSLWDAAEARFEKVIALDPDNKSGSADKAMINSASTWAKKEDYARAISCCHDLLKRWPDSHLNSDATAYVGWYATKAGKSDEAIAAYTEYLKRWPTGEDAAFAKEELEKLKNPAKSN